MTLATDAHHGNIYLMKLDAFFTDLAELNAFSIDLA
jgi:hypothetical protein